MKMIDHNHFICHLILGTFTEYPEYIFHWRLNYLEVLAPIRLPVFSCLTFRHSESDNSTF